MNSFGPYGCWAPPGYDWSQDHEMDWWNAECLRRRLRSGTSRAVEGPASSWGVAGDARPNEKMTFSAGERAHNYANMIREYCRKYPDIWTEAINPSPRSRADLSDRNSLSRIQQYLDGLECVTLKHKLAATIASAPYAPNAVAVGPSYCEGDDAVASGGVLTTRKLLPSVLSEAISRPCCPARGAAVAPTWFVKPSHPHIGSAAWISCVATESIKTKGVPPLPEGEGGTGWVFQAAVTPATFEGRKWDCRHYAAVVYDASHVVVLAFSRAFARVCVSKYNGSSTRSADQITNISLQEELAGYSHTTHEFEMARDAVRGCLQDLVKDVAVRLTPHVDQHAQCGFVMLGFDVVFTPTGDAAADPSGAEWHPNEEGKVQAFAPVLLEVNDQPCLHANPTPEGRIGEAIWTDLATQVLPLLKASPIAPSVAPALATLVGGEGKELGGFTVVHAARKPSAPLSREAKARKGDLDRKMQQHEPPFVKAYRESRNASLAIADTHNPKPEVVREQARSGL